MKDKITEGEWKHHNNFIYSGIKSNHIALCHRKTIGLNHNGSQLPDWEQEANLKAICTAVNNTYGKGINPEVVGEVIEALHWAKAFGKNGESHDKLIVEKIEQALTKVKLKG